MIRSKEFTSMKPVFVNQDEGIFSAVAITLDPTKLTLETYTEDNRLFVAAGSLVKSGSTVLGIVPEEYEITDGAVNGRMVFGGYCWASRLTDLAMANVGSLPKIVVIPYKKILVSVVSAVGRVITLHIEGAKWADAVSASHFATTGDISVYLAEKNSDGDVTLYIAGTGTGTISSINVSALIMISGSSISGLPISIAVSDAEVIVKAGSYNSSTGVWTFGGTTYNISEDLIVTGTIPYEDADAILGLAAGNRLQAIIKNLAITSSDALPSGDIVTVIGPTVTNTYTKTAFETDGSLIVISNVLSGSGLTVKIKWVSDTETTYTFDLSQAVFAAE